MAATTTLLGLVTPTQGTLTGTWGDTVNYGISDYLDIAIAGTLSFAGDGAITLANTTGSSSGNSIGATTAQYAIIRVTGTLTTAKIITGPSYSKTYLVVNAATGSTVTFKASGQTGVSIAVGETALVYYNGTDYVKVVGTATAGAAGGSTTQVQYNNAGVLAGITGVTTNGTALTLVAPNLGSPASVGTMPAFTLGGTVSGGGNQINNVVIGTTTPLAGAFTTVTTTGNAGIGTTAGGSTRLVVAATSGSLATFTQTGVTGYGVTIVPGADTVYDAFTINNAANTLNKIRMFGDGSATFAGTLSSTLGATIQGLTVGLGAGAVATNTAVGVSALAGNSTGARVTAVGALAGIVNTASDNAFIGYNTGASNTSGARNTALGSQALANNVSGTDNTAVGYTALLISTGSNNTAVGGGPYPYAPLSNNNTGSANTAVGTSALAQNTSASNNTAVGYQAGYTNQTGTLFTAFGYQAGYASVSTNRGTYIGSTSGLATTGAQNTFVGDKSGSLVTSGASNTILGRYDGNQGGLDIRTASNYIVLSDGDGNPRGIFTDTGVLLVGKTSSGNSVNGAQLSSTNQFFTNTNDYSSVFNRKGTDGISVYFQKDETNVGTISVTTVATTFNSLSDYRLKTVLGAVTGHGARIDALQPVEHIWNSNGSRTRGFLAHQFQEVYANSVTGTKDAIDADGKPVYQAMQASTSEVIADLVAELQSLRARVAQLESKP